MAREAAPRRRSQVGRAPATASGSNATSRRRMLYLIGAPGAGKTTLMRNIVAPFKGIQHRKPFSYIEYPDAPVPMAQLGTDRGTDGLVWDAQPAVMGWLLTCPYRVVLAEGDRLANDKFFAFVKQQGW